MRSFWLDPYLWIHVAGLAAFPIFLELCLVALAVGSPLLPVWLELLLVGGVGIAPVLWMQLYRPFYIFSIVAVAISPDKLTQEQRRILSLFKNPQSKWLAIGMAAVMGVALWPLYRWAPIAGAIAPWIPEWRPLGLLLAGFTFLLSNLFLQVPVSVARVLLTKQAKFTAAEALSVEQIRQNFTIFGLQVNLILPAMVADAPPSPIPAIAEPTLTSPPADETASPSANPNSSV